ncbi:MAG TPA: hypothetical protein VLX92_35350 [Kofleriaceae bacterium]|nr:hypothetical protein [Kofleriaceae bacterium]
MRPLVLACALGGAAAAGPLPLTITEEPTPHHLTMRRAAAATPAPAPASAPPRPPPAPTQASATDLDNGYLRDVREPVSVRLALGYAVDGTSLTSQPTLGGRYPEDHKDFDALHAYGFGEGQFSTRGVGLPSLSTYLSSQFQLTARYQTYDPAATTSDHQIPLAPPIATWFDRSGTVTHDAWAELKDFLTPAFAPLRVRAGEMYVYGPWVLHMYGGLAGWEGKLIRAEVYGGSRVPDYTLALADQQLDRATIGGFSVHADLRALRESIPFTIGVEGLAFSREGQNRPSSSSQLELDWRPDRDIAVIGTVRGLAGDIAEEHFQLRFRYGQVTNVVVDVTHHTAEDWRWDPSLVGPESTDPLAPKRYLELGPVLPQLLASARAGTLIAENVDLYARVAASADLSADDIAKNSFSASYLEGGGALEVRLRRTIALGVSGVARETERQDYATAQIMDVPGQPDPLPLSGAMGERNFVEGGATMRMSLGARKFSALVEVYARDTTYAQDYCLGTKCGSTKDTGIDETDFRGGGRFTVDAWIGKRLRLYASYELSSKLPQAPEITGYKSLRLVMEGVY